MLLLCARYHLSLSAFRSCACRSGVVDAAVDATVVARHPRPSLSDLLTMFSAPGSVVMAMAKMTATEIAQQAIDSAVQIFGALGVVSGQMVERLYREIRPLRIYEGATEVQQLIIARGIIKAHKAVEGQHG